MVPELSVTIIITLEMKPYTCKCFLTWDFIAPATQVSFVINFFSLLHVVEYNSMDLFLKIKYCNKYGNVR